MFTRNNKVLLIIHDVYQDDNNFPIGPAYLASALRNAGASVEVYCMDVFHYTNEQLTRKLEETDYDLIGVGFLAARFRETILDLCATINAVKGRAWLVLGGHGPSPIPEYVLEKTEADIVTLGAAEETLVEVLKCKITVGDLRKVDGIVFRNGEACVRTSPRKILTNLDTSPLPAWDLFPMEEYSTCIKTFGQEPQEKSLSFITGRGCTNRCSFCYRLEKGLRARSVPNVIEEVKILYHQYGINCFYIMDELFAFSTKRVLEFERELFRDGLHIKYGCDARVDLIDKEMILSFKRSGCKFINLGLESSSDEVLRLMGKNTVVADNIRALDIITEVGDIGIGLNFIWNNPGDTEESLMGNVALIKKYNTYMQLRTIRPVTPYPGSQLYYQAIESGALTGPGDFFDKFVNSDLITVNFTNMPTDRCYDLLLAANADLINDHYLNTGGNMAEAAALIQRFKDLYSGRITNFRGARHYNKDGKIV